MQRLIAYATALILMTASAMAAPRHYALDLSRTEVTFTWKLGADEVIGRIPVTAADIILDFGQVARSTVTVALDVGQAIAGFPFATQALRGPQMLVAAAFPAITFASDNITRADPGAALGWKISVRGIARPMTMTAPFYQQSGQDPADLDHLAILLTGAVNRHDFGADGRPGMVGNEVTFRILAYLDAVR